VEGGQPPLGVLGEDRPVRRLGAGLVVLVALAALTGCSGDDGGASSADSAPVSATAAEPTATPTPARPAARPRVRACYRLTYDQAIAPTTQADPVPCRKPHTSMTYHVGTIDAVVDGHLLAVDSKRVQTQVSTDCPRRLPRFLGGTPDALHLSMLRAVWFTPMLAESDAGADWYRCDVIAVAVAGELARLTGPLQGALARPEGRDRYGMCGTAEPGTAEFSRVICSRPHSWRAIRTVDLPGTKYPGVERVREAGEAACEEAARAVASDPTTFRWGYEWPTSKQWAAGQHYGLCWAPDPA
jgi:hypothetical protein